MSIKRNTILASALLLSLSVLVAGDQDASRRAYEVRRYREFLYSQPRSFSRRVGFGKRGETLEVLEETRVGRSIWMRVAGPGENETSWAKRLGGPGTAGEKAAKLEVALSSAALTVKGVGEEMDRQVAAFPTHFPDIEKDVLRAEDAFLSADDVETFIRDGHLTPLSENAR